MFEPWGYFEPGLHKQLKLVQFCHPSKKDRGVPNFNRLNGKIGPILAVRVNQALLVSLLVIHTVYVHIRQNKQKLETRLTGLLIF
jgi:hypothetical protein